MYRMKSWRMPLAVVFVAATVLLAGGLAVASNMGFKLNKGLVKAGSGQIGRNWTSIPYHNPYGNFGGLCSQTGLPSGAVNTAVITRLDGAPGGRGFVTQTCQAAIAAGGGEALVAGEGVQIVEPFGICSGGTTLCSPSGVCPTGQTCAPNPTSIIIVGSHNPSFPVTVPATGAGQIGNFWFAVPYHTTAVNLDDLCRQAAMVNGLAERLDATTGNFTTVLCPSVNAAAVNLVLGEHVRLRQPLNGVTFTPAHF